MKSLFTAISIILLFSSLLFSQDFAKKGIWELGGTVGFSSQTSVNGGTASDKSTTTISISPSFGYFITDNFELGLMPLSYTSSSYNGSSSSLITIMLAPTYNFDIHSNVYPFITALIGYGSYSAGSNTYSGLDYGGKAGVKIQIAKNVLVNAGISYVMYTYNPSGVSDRNGYNLLSVEAGFSIFLK